MLQHRLGCGRIRPNARQGARDKCFVYVVRRQADLIDPIIPFLRRHPIRSEKRLQFGAFAAIVEAMVRNEHRSNEGFMRLLRQAIEMDGGGRYRRVEWTSRILRGHTPDTESTVKIWSDPCGDTGSQAEQKRPGRRAQLTLWEEFGGNRCVGPYPPRA
jgi:hypothetical protein